MARRFNTAGPSDERRHYTIPPESRLPDARRLAVGDDYFVPHAPRQTGKTTLLRSHAKSLTAEGEFAALAASCEAGEPFGERIGAVEQIVLSELRISAQIHLPADLQPPPAWPTAPEGQQLRAGLVA